MELTHEDIDRLRRFCGFLDTYIELNTDAREQYLHICGGNTPYQDTLSKLYAMFNR